jgi:ATP synthase protein I
MESGTKVGTSLIRLRKISQAGKFRGEMDPVNDNAPKQPAPQGSERLQGAQYAGIGIQFLISLLLGLYGGQWLDRKFDTKPLFLLVGVFVGAGAAFFSMYRVIMRPPPK